MFKKYRILNYVKHHKRATEAKVCVRFRVSKQYMSDLRSVVNGNSPELYIRNDFDKGVQYLALTEKGHEYVAKIQRDIFLLILAAVLAVVLPRVLS